MPVNVNIKALESSLFNLETHAAPFYGLFYGYPGSGKTVLAMQLAQALTPPDKGILLVDASTGWVTLNNHPELKRRVGGVVFKNHDQLRQIAEAIKTTRGGFANIGAVVLDEFSVIAASILNDVAETRESSSANKLEPGALDQRDYGLAQNIVRRLIFDFQKAGVHLIATAHERRDKVNKQSANSLIRTAPAFPPAMWGLDVARLFHLVGRITAELVITPGKPDTYLREIQVHATNLVEAKSRVGGLKPRVSATTLINRTKEWSLGNETLVPIEKEIIEPEQAFDPEELNGIEVD